MSIYDTLQKSWETAYSSFTAIEQEKLNMLLSVEDEVQIRSTIELLLGFGDCGLCQILKEDGDQMFLIDGLSPEILWKQVIIEQVTSSQSKWFTLYEQGCFDQMEFVFFESAQHSDLNKGQYQRILKESLRQVSVPNGRFVMGALKKDTKIGRYEQPRHEVTFTQGISVCIYVVTQVLYESVMAENPSHFKGMTRPVESVSWCDAVLFCNKLSVKEGLEPCYTLPDPIPKERDWSQKVVWEHRANGYRLPTEAEWEYCARGGEEHLYAGSDDVHAVAWCSDNKPGGSRGVGLKKPNGFGLYDMSGNVSEWVWDRAIRSYGGPVTDPVFADGGDANRIIRGGSWLSSKYSARVSHRTWFERFNYGLGFRILRSIRDTI